MTQEKKPEVYGNMCFPGEQEGMTFHTEAEPWTRVLEAVV